jgi:hypothetical protein
MAAIAFLLSPTMSRMGVFNQLMQVNNKASATCLALATSRSAVHARLGPVETFPEGTPNA